MATVLFDGELKRGMDWADPMGNGQPASGRAVQNFINSQLDKKFGYLYFDYDTNKYLIFADFDDYDKKWKTNHELYADLVLARFDAPAPASIVITDPGDEEATLLAGSTGNNIWFRYYVKTSAGVGSKENLTARIVIRSGGNTRVDTIPITYTNEAGDINGNGALVEIPIDSYINGVNDYDFTITLVTNLTQVTRNLSYKRNVVSLSIDVGDFNSFEGVPYSTGDAYVIKPLTLIGADTKILDIYVDGQKLYQTNVGRYSTSAISSGKVINESGIYDFASGLSLYKMYTDNNGVTVHTKWPSLGTALPETKIVDGVEVQATFDNAALAEQEIFGIGKHTIQLQMRTPAGINKYFYSNVIYFEIYVYDEQNATINESYVLYNRELSDVVTDDTYNLTIESEQYKEFEISFGIFNTKGNNVEVTGKFINNDETDPDEKVIDQLDWDLKSSSFTSVEYTFKDKPKFNEGETSHSVSVELIDKSNNTLLDTIDVVVKKSSANIAESNPSGDTLKYKYTALNRYNTSADKDVWVNTAEQAIVPEIGERPAIFSDKIQWNTLSGWNNKDALILTAGATVEFPVSIFDLYDRDYGLTFEIEFETFNVKDDSAVIMDYSNPAGKSFIKITSTSASTNSEENAFINTNFKDNVRTKIAFVYNPQVKWDDDNTYSGRKENPNLIFIIVNGVLDRVCRWGNGQTADGDKLRWTNAQGANANSFTIGDPLGRAGVKLYSIRIYNYALTPEQEFMNFMYDSPDVLDVYNRNNILDEHNEISFNHLLTNNVLGIPIMLLSFDIDQQNRFTSDEKKANQMAEVLYIDPASDHKLDFYARNVYIGCQGTSSMAYPTKNLRLYLDGKAYKAGAANKGGSINNYSGLYWDDAQGKAVTDDTIVGHSTTPAFETEFWPYEFYKEVTDFNDVADFVDGVASISNNKCVIPYGLNNKQDGKIGYHPIGSNRTYNEKIRIAKSYEDQGEQLFKRNTIETVKDGETKVSYTFEPVSAYDPDYVLPVNEHYYMSAYRKLRTPEMSDDYYLTYIKQLIYSGYKIYTMDDKLSNKYTQVKKGQISATTDYYSIGCRWRQYNGEVIYKNGEQISTSNSGWTDRWTLKADFAESSMCHNAGVGRLWGKALYSLEYDNPIQTEASGWNNHNHHACRTSAQEAADGVIDIRTSCDGKPIILFTRQPKGYDKNTGRLLYDDAKFSGLFNIMTDKSSVALFGFQDMKGVTPNNEIVTRFKAYNGNLTPEEIEEEGSHNVQCWEFRQNGSSLATCTALNFDNLDKDGNIASSTKLSDKLGEDRQVFIDFESRFPDSGKDRHSKMMVGGKEVEDPNWEIKWPDDFFGTESNSLESLWHWLNFTKPATKLLIDGVNGYEAIDYLPITNTDEQERYLNENNLFIRWMDAGNYEYVLLSPDGPVKYGEPDKEGNQKEAVWVKDDGNEYFAKRLEIDHDNVVLEPSDEKITSDIYLGKVESFDSMYRCVNPDGTKDDEQARKYLVEVYVTKDPADNKWKYIDNTNTVRVYSGDLPEEPLHPVDASTWVGRTYHEFFDATMADHFDLAKVAAYYIYMIRFGAADQVVKNCMITTEDGKHWYFINYDNDTILGVRNDGHLVFNWDFDRTTYDSTPGGNSYAYTGINAVLWNNLSTNERFMNMVKDIDNKMSSTGLLDANTVINYFNEKQEGSWCERMYNAQEDIKYLSTFKENFTRTTYLEFMHGTRHSHRTWWISNRWNLYNSLWVSGEYAARSIWFKAPSPDTNVPSKSNRVPFVCITSDSKFTYTVIKNLDTMPDGGETGLYNPTIGANESYEFRLIDALKIGDPISLKGVEKAKVVNFRSSITFLGDTQLDYGDKPWAREHSVLEKLLIGNGKDKFYGGQLSGLNNFISLEEIDLRGAARLSESVLVSNLTNLHRFRADGSMINSFAPSTLGLTMYELTLPNEPDHVENDGTRTYSFALETLDLQNISFERQDNYVVYQTGVTKNAEDDDRLPLYPYGKDSDAFRYCTNYSEEYEVKDSNDNIIDNTNYVFMVVPTRKLKNVTLNNIKGINTLAFIRDWYANIVAAGANPFEYNLTIENIDWSKEVLGAENGFNVNDLKMFIEDPVAGTMPFNITNRLTGTVYLRGLEDSDGKLTQAEYDKLMEVFNNDTYVIKTSLNLKAEDSLFFNVIKGGNESVDYEKLNGITPENLTGMSKYYILSRGDSIELNFNQFSNNPKQIEYSYTKVIKQGNTINRNVPVTGTDQINFYQDGNTMTISPVLDLIGTLNPFLMEVKLVEQRAGMTIAAAVDHIFIYIVQNTSPVVADFTRIDVKNLATEEMLTSTGLNFSVVPRNDEEYNAKIYVPKFTGTNEVTSTVKNVTINADSLSSSVNINKETIKYKEEGDEKFIEFNFTPKLQQETNVFDILVDVEFSNTKIVTLTSRVTIETLIPDTIKLKDISTYENYESSVDVSGNILISDLRERTYVLDLIRNDGRECNIKVNSIAITDKLGEAFEKFVLEVNPDDLSIKIYALEKNYSFDDNKTVVFDVEYDYVLPRTKSVEYTVHYRIIYPDSVVLERNNFEADNWNMFIERKDVTLLNNQGTDNFHFEENPSYLHRELVNGIWNGIADDLTYRLKVSSNIGTITQGYTIKITNINVELPTGYEGYVSTETVNGEGNNNLQASFKLKINVLPNTILNAKVSVTYLLNYDGDANLSTLDKNRTDTITFNVDYTYADGILGITQLDTAKNYALMKNGTYYTISENPMADASLRTLIGNETEEYAFSNIVGIAVYNAGNWYNVSIKKFGYTLTTTPTTDFINGLNDKIATIDGLLTDTNLVGYVYYVSETESFASLFKSIELNPAEEPIFNKIIDAYKSTYSNSYVQAWRRYGCRIKDKLDIINHYPDERWMNSETSTELVLFGKYQQSSGGNWTVVHYSMPSNADIGTFAEDDWLIRGTDAGVTGTTGHIVGVLPFIKLK